MTSKQKQHPVVLELRNELSNLHWGIGHPMSPFELKVSDRVDAVLATLHSTLSLGLGYVSSTPGQGLSGSVRVPLLPPNGFKIPVVAADRRSFRYCKTCCTPGSRPSIFAVARPAGEWSPEAKKTLWNNVQHLHLCFMCKMSSSSVQVVLYVQ